MPISQDDLHVRFPRRFHSSAEDFGARTSVRIISCRGLITYGVRPIKQKLPLSSKAEGIKVVIFDYGGTLYKSTKPWTEVRTQGLAAAFGFLEQAGLKTTFAKFTQTCDSVFDHYAKVESKEDKDIADKVKYQSIVDKLFPRLPKAKRVKLAAGANKAFWDVAIENYPIRPSAKGALSHIRSRGLRMGIVSNHHNYDSLVGHLTDTGIHSHFDVVLASEREGVRKPNAVIFNRSLEALKVDKKHAIFVGDSPRHDIVGAKAMGMRTVLIDDGTPRDSWMIPVGVNPSDAEPDYVIRDLLELRDIVDSLLGKPSKTRGPKGSR